MNKEEIREYIFKLRCHSIEEAEQQRKETEHLLSQRLIAAQKQCYFTTQSLFDSLNFENRIKITIEGLDSLDNIKSLELAL